MGRFQQMLPGCDKLNLHNIWQVDENLKVKTLSIDEETNQEDEEDDDKENVNYMYNKEELTNKKESIMENLKVPGYSILVLTGKGYVLEEEGDINTIRYGILTKDYKITLDGKDVTKEIELDSNKYAFMNKCFELQHYDVQMRLSQEMQLPPSIFCIPEGTTVDQIKLMSVGYAFPGEKYNLIVDDFIFLDDEEQVSDSYQNSDGLLEPFTSDDITYHDNQEWYDEHYGDEETFTLRWEGDDDEEEEYDDYEEDNEDED